MNGNIGLLGIDCLGVIRRFYFDKEHWRDRQGRKGRERKRFSAGTSTEKLGKWAAQYIENT